MIRLQDKTPEVYCSESRDFQLFCRFYDCVVNGIKFDIDTIPDILDAMTCRTSMLQLLQTKLGFFTNKKLTDDALRYVLTAFPIMVKNKGSLKSIQQAVNVFFKVYGIRSEVKVWLVSEPTKIQDVWVNDHTLVIGINSTVKDISLLEEIFRYILPTGFDYHFYFYNEASETDPYLQEDNATLLFSSDNINSQVRLFDGEYNEDIVNRLLGAIDTINIASSDSPIITFNGTYNSGDDSTFLGVFSSIEDVQIPDNNHTYIILVNGLQYISINDHWQVINFRGIQESIELVSNPQDYDIICISSNKSYHCIENNNYVTLNYRGIVSKVQDVLSPQKHDCVRCGANMYVRTDSDWVEYNYLNNVYNLPDISEGDYNTIYYLDKYDYYMYSNEKWDKTYIPIYMLNQSEINEEV